MKLSSIVNVVPFGGNKPVDDDHATGTHYCDSGINRFVNGDYAWAMQEGMMVAYVRGEGDRDYKTSLQELSAQDLGRLPEYRVRERGPDHQKEFTATVVIGGETLGSGVGRSKKEAEQQAAREAHTRIARVPRGEGNGDGTS